MGTKFSGKKVLKIWGKIFKKKSFKTKTKNYHEKRFGNFGDKIAKKKFLFLGQNYYKNIFRDPFPTTLKIIEKIN